jgi:hypothetical protein
MHDSTKSWGLGDSGDTSIYTEVGLKMSKLKDQSGNGSYNIQLPELGFIYSCVDHLYRGVHVNTFML